MVILTKVNQFNYDFGTFNLVKLFETNSDITNGQDNLSNYLIYKTTKSTCVKYIPTGMIYLHNKIQIQVNGVSFIKSFDSFDQNNLSIANKIRSYVCKLIGKSQWENTLGIGGEFYIYFHFIQSKKYYGISNHQSIINDANTIIQGVNSDEQYNPNLVFKCIKNLALSIDLEEIQSENFNLLADLCCEQTYFWF
jgi:hypothetical protein